MIGFIFRRLLWTIPVLILISIITFLLMHAAPGGPWDRDEERGKEIPAQVRKVLNQEFGLEKPLWRQYTMYMFGDFRDDGSFRCGAVCGNLGPSYKQRGKTVQNILFVPQAEDGTFWDSKFGKSLRLAVFAPHFPSSRPWTA